MPAESLREIAEAVGGTLLGDDAGGRPSGYSIDSRTLKQGDLFFAIVGAKQDGHRFVADARARGAAGSVVSDRAALPEGAAGILVKDTTRALQDLAARRRARLGPKVIGITGSSGKTTTKEMTRRVLEGTFDVMASKGNLNNLYGLPLSLLELEDHHQVAVLEMGISSHGEMTRLAEIADPDMGVLTNVHGAHLEFFSGPDDYACAKAELFAAMRANTTGIFNNDDERSRRIASSFGGYAVTFAMDAAADFTASGYRSEGLGASAFEVRHGGRRVPVRLRFGGAHHAMNALAAVAAGYMLGCDLETMAGRLESLDPLAMRGRVLHLAGGVQVLDDSYNANPGGVRAALAVLAHTDPGAGRRIAILGDMLELGPSGPALHREVGRALAACGVQAAIAVGPLSRETAAAAREAGFAGTRTFDSIEEAIPEALKEVRPGDVVLVKASRGIGLDRVVAALKERLGPATNGGAA
jgi:UDP-N-acetylmuramoyl-tripeptide--D-alanyl-D-alanine ligase